MAASDKISQLKFRPYDRSSIDFRTARLPKKRRALSIGISDGPDDYNPREHREPKQQIPVWMAYFNMIRSGLGAGLLGFPVAISQAGLVFGAIMCAFCGLLIIHSHLVLLKCLNEISRRLRIPIISYRYGFRIAMLHGPPITHCLGRRGTFIISTFMIMSQVGICAVFIDFTADSLRDVMDWPSARHIMLYLLVPYIILELFMKTLKIVSYVTLISTAFNIVGLVMVFYHIFLEPHGELKHSKIEPLSLAFCFGTFLFNLSSVGVVLSLDQALVKPEVMVRCGVGVVTLGMGIPLTIALTFGMLGYWSFGTMEENILRSLPYDDSTTIAAVALYMTSVALSYPLQCDPAIQIILEIVRNRDEYEQPKKKTLRLIEYIARPSFVIVTFICAYLVPIQAPLVAFVGNLCTTMLAVVFPALMDLCLMYPGPYGRCNIYIYKNVFIILLGITAWLIGIALCGKLIYIRVKAAQSPNDSDYFK